MKKKKASKSTRSVRHASSTEPSPIIQMGVLFIIAAAIIIAFVVGKSMGM